MKQTQHGSSSQIPTGIQAAIHSDQPEADQFKDVDKRNWPDFDNPGGAAAQQSAQASKSTGETGEGSKAVGIPPLDNPPEPQASTSTADIQDPTENPEEEKDPTLVAYVKSYQEASKVWLATVKEKKEQVYKTLFDKLLAIGNPHIPKFNDADRKIVLDCIADKSGKSLVRMTLQFMSLGKKSL